MFILNILTGSLPAFLARLLNNMTMLLMTANKDEIAPYRSSSRQV